MLAPLASPTIDQASIKMTHPTRARLTVQSGATAAFVSVESAAVVGGFSDGAFMLLPSRAVELEFVAKERFDLKAFAAGLSVRSLRDTYE